MHRGISVTHQLHHWQRFAWNDARHRSSAVAVHRHHKLARPAAAFIPYFVVNRVQICAVGWQKIWWNERGCLVSEGWLSHDIGVQEPALLEDKELATDLTHDNSRLWARSTSRQYASLIFTLDKHQIYSGPFAATWTQPWTPLPTWWSWALQQTL